MTVDMLCDALLDDDVAQENEKLRAEIERLRTEVVQLDRARGMDTLDWLQIKGERDELREEMLAVRSWQAALVEVLNAAKAEGDQLQAAYNAITAALADVEVPIALDKGQPCLDRIAALKERVYQELARLAGLAYLAKPTKEATADVIIREAIAERDALRAENARLKEGA